MHSESQMPPKDAPYRIFDTVSATAAAGLPRGTVVRLAVPGMDSELAARFGSSITAALGECGCRLSAAFLVVTVCAAAVIDVLQWSFVRQRPFTAIASELAIVFLASGIGRIAGVAHARRTLRNTLAGVSDRIDDVVAKEESWAA